MSASSTVRLLRALGSFWFTGALLAVIGGAFFEPVRHLINSLAIVPYLALFIALMAPGVALLWLSERMAG